MAIRVMMIDEDIDQINAVEKYFSSSSSINVVKVISNKEEALNSLDGNYDVLVINLLLSGCLCNLILAKMKEMGISKKVIITSEFVIPDMMNSLNDYTLNYLLKKPYSCNELERVITTIYVKEEKHVDKKLKLKITDMLHNLGIPSNIKGYNYIRDGIEMMYNDTSLMGAITKELYPKLARSYDTTSSRVDRAIRHAIEISWSRGDYDLMEEIFGNSVDCDKSKPTNGEFIVTLADRLKLESKYV